MDNSSVHMIEIMINGLIVVPSVYMAVQHQVDGGIKTAFASTSTITMEDHMGLYYWPGRGTVQHSSR